MTIAAVELEHIDPINAAVITIVRVVVFPHAISARNNIDSNHLQNHHDNIFLVDLTNK